jgi:hypothetical protein
MILDRHRQMLVGRIERHSLGDRPRTEYALHLEAEIIVKPPRGMFLDDEDPAR